ncbi:dioxygenase family protein [Ferviditalea candida]|uniref:Class III extradiol ring-cleavage dioxygenase n=1 Tax=Ferviditalea candida TaxID=3108399 RepID=A0ABU5ZDK5_9BACL|nr:class III extradiol ring-cleavage dioxygenase [Paenibacillaceae bacterium T2]
MIPSFFISHSTPRMSIEVNEYTQFLQQLSQTLPRPKAIILFSAHWESNLQQVSEVLEYPVIYDFYGFPDEMYQIRYPAKGDIPIAQEIEGLLDKYGVSYEVETTRGLDHGAWVILRLLYPNADIPVISMSVNPQLAPKEQYAIGKALSALRTNDIFIIGSGVTVHNGRALKRHEKTGQADEWALEFDDWLAHHLKNWDVDSLFNYERLAPSVQLAVPVYGNEHFIPLFYAMGAADDVKKATLLHRSYRWGNLSQSVWQFG